MTALAVVVALCTLRSISRQTGAALRAAEAAVTQAQAMLTEQRAWLLIEDLRILNANFQSMPIAGKPMCEFSCCARNYGKTPAFAIWAKVQFDIRGVGDPPSIAEIGNARVIGMSERIIPQQGTERICEAVMPHGWPSQESRQGLALEQLVLWAYGYIRYLDAQNVEHETRFCYRTGSDRTTLYRAGSPEHNQAT